jgi:hypothetical protein
MPAGNTYEAIATQTLGSTAATVTFSSIPSTYTDLVVTVTTSTTGDINFRINGDTGTNYSQTVIYAYSAFGSGRQSNATSHWLNYGSNNGNFLALLQFNNYSNTTTFKTSLLRDGSNGSSTDVMVNLWRSTSAINSLTFIPPSTFAIGTTISLYGIKAA